MTASAVRRHLWDYACAFTRTLLASPLAGECASTWSAHVRWGAHAFHGAEAPSFEHVRASASACGNQLACASSRARVISCAQRTIRSVELPRKRLPEGDFASIAAREYLQNEAEREVTTRSMSCLRVLRQLTAAACTRHVEQSCSATESDRQLSVSLKIPRTHSNQCNHREEMGSGWLCREMCAQRSRPCSWQLLARTLLCGTQASHDVLSARAANEGDARAHAHARAHVGCVWWARARGRACECAWRARGCVCARPEVRPARVGADADEGVEAEAEQQRAEQQRVLLRRKGR
eukprot:6204917-Pleurochrysis_carterae.AAC.3